MESLRRAWRRFQRTEVRVALLAVVLVAAMSEAARAQQYALLLEDGAMVSFPHADVMTSGETATIEAWVRATAPPTDERFQLFRRHAPSAEHKELTVLEDGRILYVYAGSPWGDPFDEPPSPCASTAPDLFPFDGQWHHIAFVRRADRTWEVYLDGVSVHVDGPATGFGDCCWLTCDIIDAMPPTRIHGQDGWQIRGLRFSDVERYHGPFTPLLQWAPDEHTLMLLPFLEGEGQLVHDLGPAAQVGEITGGHRWVLVGDELGERYCRSNVNSSGLPARLSAFGSDLLAENALVLEAVDLPPYQFGLCAFSSRRDFVPLFGGSQGNLCLGEPIVRWSRHILFSGSEGVVHLAPDLDALPQGLAFLPGETWMFQLWFRDVHGGVFTSNTTDAVAITFE